LSKWTKHADWQPLPRAVASNLPICPLCKRRPKWEVSDKFGWTTRGYGISCTLCGAEWEYRTSDWSKSSSLVRDLAFGGFGAMHRIMKIANDDSVWVLRKAGSSADAERFLGKEVNISSWKQMVGSFCAKCGIALAIDEEFCPDCGVRRDTDNATL
jgi:hypothetical protein